MIIHWRHFTEVLIALVVTEKYAYKSAKWVRKGYLLKSKSRVSGGRESIATAHTRERRRGIRIKLSVLIIRNGFNVAMR